MSRSVKKNPGGGYTTVKSEKTDKKIWHRRWRHKSKVNLNQCSQEKDHGEDFKDILFREMSNKWSMGKDGKGWHEGYILEKDIHPEEKKRRFLNIMRK